MKPNIVFGLSLLTGFSVSAGWLFLSPSARAEGFQAEDLAIVGEPFRIRLPKGKFEVHWGDGKKTVTTDEWSSHQYQQTGTPVLSVVSLAGAQPLPLDYVALMKTSKPRFFLENPEGGTMPGPAGNLPLALRLEKRPADFPLVSIPPTDSFSVEAWVKVDALRGDQVIASSGNAGPGGFRLVLSANSLGFTLLDGGTFSAPAGGSIKPGSWSHVAVLYDRVPLFPFANRVRFFIDGVPLAEGSVEARDSGAVRCEGLRLGGDEFLGEIAAVAIYDKLLFPLAIWDRVKAVRDPNGWTVTVAPPGAGTVQVAEPKISQTVDVPLDPNPETDNGPALRQAISAAGPGTRLRLIDRDSGKAGGRYFIRSMMKAPHYSGMTIDGKTDFELDGNGATLVFSDHLARYMWVRKSMRLAIRNLSFDLNPTYARVGLYAKFLEIDRRTGWVKAQLVNGRDGSPDPIIPERASYWRWRPHRPDTLRLNRAGPSFRNSSYVTKPKPDGSGRPGVITLQLKQKPDDKFWDELEQYAAGDNFYQINNGDFSCNAVSLEFCEDVTFERVNYYATLGMVFLSADIRRTRVASCVIGAPPGMTAADRPLSAGADGYHFHLTQGDIIFENNEVALTDDDPISIKDSMWIKLTRIDDHTLDAGSKGIAKGDPVELLDREYLPTGYRATVMEVEGTKLKLDARLPATLEPGMVLVNRSHHTKNWIIRNNHFHDYYGRVMLYTDYGTVTGNRVQDSLYHLGLSTAYYEVAGISRNVVTHRNLFVNTTADASNWGGNPNVVVFHQIAYSANSFIGMGLKVAQLGDSLLVRNGFYRFAYDPETPSASIKGSRNVLFADNLQFSPGAAGFQLVDQKNQNLVLRDNRAFAEPVRISVEETR